MSEPTTVTLTAAEAQIVAHALDAALGCGQISGPMAAALRQVMRRLVPVASRAPKAPR